MQESKKYGIKNKGCRCACTRTHTHTNTCNCLYSPCIDTPTPTHTHTPPHLHTGEPRRMGQVFAISPHINHPPLNNLSVVLTVGDCKDAAEPLLDNDAAPCHPALSNVISETHKLQSARKWAPLPLRAKRRWFDGFDLCALMCRVAPCLTSIFQPHFTFSSQNWTSSTHWSPEKLLRGQHFTKHWLTGARVEQNAGQLCIQVAFAFKMIYTLIHTQGTKMKLF